MSSFNFQEPGSAKLQEAIETTANSADSGVGVFAFASTSGVKALFEVPLLVKLLSQKKPFHLIVGIDAITNAEALLSIADEVKKYKGYLIAEAFFHNHPASTFHPKFIWFAKGKELRVIVGSGNLTLRGFGKKSAANPAPGNWEAFGVQTLTGEAVAETLGDFEKWLKAIFQPTDTLSRCLCILGIGGERLQVNCTHRLRFKKRHKRGSITPRRMSKTSCLVLNEGLKAP